MSTFPIQFLFLSFILFQQARAAPFPGNATDKISAVLDSGNAVSGPGGQASGGSSVGAPPRLLSGLINIGSNSGGDGGIATSGDARTRPQRLDTLRGGRCKVKVASDNFLSGPGGQAQGGNGQAVGVINILSGNGGRGGIASSGGIIRGRHRA